MANNITILGQIKPGGFEGVVDAEDVAYSYKTEGNIKQIDKSVKEKIEEIERKSSEFTGDISSDKVKVGDKTLTETLSEIDTSSLDKAVTDAQSAATQATNSENNIKLTSNNLTYGYFTNITGEIVATYNLESGKYQDANGIQVINSTDSDGNIIYKLSGNVVYFVKGVLTLGQDFINKFNKVIEVSDTLGTGFDSDAQIKIVSTSEYNAKLEEYKRDPSSKQLEDNTIYMCYDSEETLVIDEEGSIYPISVYIRKCFEELLTEYNNKLL